MGKREVDEIIRKHSAKLAGQMNDFNSGTYNYSGSYQKFRDEMVPKFTSYEKWCHSLGNIVKINIAEKDREKIQKSIDIAHLNIKPWQVMTLSIMSFLSVFLIGIFVSVAIMLINSSNGLNLSAFPLGLFFLIVFVSLFLFYYVNNIPVRLANKWRLKASSQMVPAILYIVVYMRHTSNLEKAIAFASENLEYPLALDFKKIFYDVQIGKFPTIKESLDNYLECWRDYAPSFIESFHLIESSLFEPSSARRIATLEKALQVVLDGIYDKMLKFTHDVRSPLTNVYMLGVVLPTLAIALIPLASAMLNGAINWVHVFLLFNLIIPFFVFYMVDKVLMLRPGGYGETSLLERNKYYPEYKNKNVYFGSFLLILPFILIGLSPLLFQYTPLQDMLGLSASDFSFAEIGLGSVFGEDMFFDFKTNDAGEVKGPFGLGALLLGLFIPLGVAIFFSNSFKQRTKNLILEREKTKKLESEFNNSLFQLGNRIGNGVPPELVFGKVAESSKGLTTENFFKKVNYNIRQMGMGVEKAVFDPKRGAINYFPSDLIATSMKILIESSKKGLKIAATSLMSISEYVKNIGKINQRLKDMLAEIVSDMKSNMTFLAPLLSGIVVGLATMITAILNKIPKEDLGNSSLGGFDMRILGDVVNMIPPYYLQISIGIYLVEIIFILTATLVSIDSGNDPLGKTNKIGINLRKGMLFYFFVSFLATLGLFFLASQVVG